jgi:hypothetical protein
MTESGIRFPGRIEPIAQIGGQIDLDSARKGRLPGDEVPLAVAEPIFAAFYERPVDSESGAHQVLPLVPRRVR